VDRADRLLPKDAVIDFALIDTERLELKVMKGLEETIERSPNMVIMCEWWARELKERGQAEGVMNLLKWLKEHNYRFYYQNNNPAGNCDDVHFIE
jgi:hypothetical protein